MSGFAALYLTYVKLEYVDKEMIKINQG